MGELSDAEIRELQLEFCREAVERLDLAESYLLKLEAASDAPVMTDLKRVLHGMKGSSSAAGFDEFGTLVHDMETRVGGGSPTKALVDQLLRDLDRLRDIVTQFMDEN